MPLQFSPILYFYICCYHRQTEHLPRHFLIVIRHSCRKGWIEMNETLLQGIQPEEKNKRQTDLVIHLFLISGFVRGGQDFNDILSLCDGLLGGTVLAFGRRLRLF